MIHILKIILLLIGIFMCANGITFMICYLNLMTIGYNLFEYVNFIIRRIECLNFIFGLILITIILIKEG